MSTVTKAEERPAPVAGDLFRAAAKLPVEGVRRRKLLCLIAAWADAGESCPPLEALAEKLGVKPARAYGLATRLVEDGWLEMYQRKSRRARLEGRALRFVVVVDAERDGA